MVHTNKLSGQITIKQIVMDVIEDLGAESKWYKNMVRWAIRGYGQLSLFHLDVFEEVKLTSSDLNICTVPDDYVNWVAIGVPYYGKLFTVSRDNKLITTTTTVAGNNNTTVEILSVEEGEGITIGASSYRHYGEVGGKNQYRIQWINSRQFVLNGLPKATVILRYVSNGLNASGESFVPVLAQEALIAYIKMKFVERDPKSMSSLQYWKQNYEEQTELLRYAQFASLEDIADAVYETWTQTVKR